MKDSRSPGLSRREALSWLGIGAGLGLLSTLKGGGDLLAAPLPQTAASSASKVAFPKGAIIRTVLTDVSPDALGTGATLFHQHLSIGDPLPSWLPPPAQPRPAPSVDEVIEQVRAAAKEGISCIVDGGSIGLGRDVDHLRTISSRSGVHVVVGGGLYTQPRYPPDIATKTEDQIVADFARDAKAERWGALGEIGTSLTMHPDEVKALHAVSKFHLRTGLPIFTHTPHEGCQKCALDQLDIFEKQGVNPRIVCIGHLSDLRDDPKAQTQIAIAKRGAFVGFDTVGRLPRLPEHVGMLLAVLEAGYEDRVLLATDGRTGVEVLTVFVPKLREAGV